MMVRFLKAPLEYALGKKARDARMPEVLSGNVASFKRLRKRLGRRARVRHITISYAEEDRPSKTAMVQDAEELLHHFCARQKQPFKLDRLESLLVLHREAAGDQIGPGLEARKAHHRFALHMFVIEHDLLTGNRVQLYFDAAHRRALGAWLKTYNQRRGYACPTDPARSRKKDAYKSQAELNAFAEKLAQVTLAGTENLSWLTPKTWADLLRPHSQQGRIECRARTTDLVARVQLPRMRGRTTLIARSEALDVRAVKAVVTRHAKTDRRTDVLPLRATYVSGKRVPKLDPGADALLPHGAGAPPELDMLRDRVAKTQPSQQPVPDGQSSAPGSSELLRQITAAASRKVADNTSRVRTPTDKDLRPQ